MVTATWTEKGAWPVAPDGRLGAAAFAGIVIGFSAFVLFGALFWIGFVMWYHDLPRAGNLGGAIAFATLYAVTVAAFGVALGAWMAERERALQFIAGASIPLLFLSGFAFPVESFVEPVRWLSLAFPSTPGIRGFIALNQMGASLEEAAPQVLHLAILAAVYLACGWLAASWRARGPKPAAHEMQNPHTNVQDPIGPTAQDGRAI
jgi:ABC-2 type transport system permease protein